METWSSADGSEVDTGVILTTAANAAIGRIHDRVPVVIAPEDFSRWLDCKTQEPREVADLMRPVQDDFFEMIPVSDKVNKVANAGKRAAGKDQTGEGRGADVAVLTSLRSV